MSFFEKLLDVDHMWLAIGLIGQIISAAASSSMWLASEKKKKASYRSRSGGAASAAASCCSLTPSTTMDPVFILGQGLVLLIYARNLVFILKPKGQQPQTGAQSETSGA